MIVAGSPGVNRSSRKTTIEIPTSTGTSDRTRRATKVATRLLRKRHVSVLAVGEERRVVALQALPGHRRAFRPGDRNNGQAVVEHLLGLHVQRRALFRIDQLSRLRQGV